MVQNYHDCLAELDNEEFQANVEVANAYTEFLNIGAGIGCGFKNTSELKPMKYKAAINGPDGEAWK